MHRGTLDVGTGSTDVVRDVPDAPRTSSHRACDSSGTRTLVLNRAGVQRSRSMCLWFVSPADTLCVSGLYLSEPGTPVREL
jgi:hypothetical protein